jgi:hypothetical protein
MDVALIALIGYYAGIYGIDPNVAVAVAKVESSFKVDAVGGKGEIGLFQIMPAIYPNVRKESLFDPKVNIELGIRHLAWNKKYCKHKENKTYLVCYNYGIKNAEKVKHPTLWPYYKKVMAEVNKLKMKDVAYVD